MLIKDVSFPKTYPRLIVLKVPNSLSLRLNRLETRTVVVPPIRSSTLKINLVDG